MVAEEQVNKRYAALYEKWLQIVNRLTLGVIKAVNRVKPYWQAYSRSAKTPIHFIADFSSRIVILFVELPRSKPVMYCWYVSVQEWYLTPKKIEPKIRKALKYFRKYSVPDQDSYVAIVAKRATRPASRKAASEGVPVRSPDAAVNDMRKYFGKRYDQIVAAVRGKRIFRELVFLVAMLQEIVRELAGAVIEVFTDLTLLLRYAEEGFTVPAGLGPPTMGDA